MTIFEALVELTGAKSPTRDRAINKIAHSEDLHSEWAAARRADIEDSYPASARPRHDATCACGEKVPDYPVGLTPVCEQCLWR